MTSTLHALLKRHGLTVFMDVRLLARGLKARLRFAAARRQAEYVLIDHHRVPVGFDAEGLARLHLNRIHHVRDGLGYTKWAEVPRGSGMPVPAGEHAGPGLRMTRPQPRHAHGHGAQAQR